MSQPQLPPTVICGAVRNGGAGLAGTLAAIEGLKRVLERSEVVIVTNDNTDGTDALLAEWQRASATHHLVRVDGLASAIPGRIERLAVARNFYLLYMRSSLATAYPLTLVLDMDGPNQSLDTAEFARVVASQPPGWSGLFANQLAAYYDVYALRHDAWCPNDCWDEVERAIRTRTLRHPFKSGRARAARKRLVYDRQIKIPPDHPRFKVRSAFGGLGLYKTEAMANCWYGTRTTSGAPCCDHVVLNEEITRRGGALLIVPNLLNEAPAEHLRPESGQPIPAGLKL